MKLRLLAAVAFGLALAGSEAAACPAPSFFSSIFFEQPPLWAPAEETVLKVRVREVRGGKTVEKIGYGDCRGACYAVLEVLEVARGRDPGKTIRLEPHAWSSCGVPISVGDQGYVSGVLQRWRGGWVMMEPRTERAYQRAERQASTRRR